MKELAYYFHAGSGNHGCEAIVRSTTKLLGTPVKLISNEPVEDKKYNLDEIVEIVESSKEAFSFLEKINLKIKNEEKKGYYFKAKHEVKKFADNSIAMSIGGDNYCYGDAYNWHLAGLNEHLHKKNIKTVLWGCSIEPTMLTESVKEDLAKYDLIVARESISYDALKDINVNVVLACDPAFTLETEEVKLPKEFIPGQTVGINISPLILNSAQNKDVVLKNYINMIKHIIIDTNYNIALIPHVVQEGNDDRIVLKKLYDTITDKGRVSLIENCNCMKLKGYISKCAMFIGARTHATIAAYSTGVPTLVIGYSTKAIGIARDLFGTEKNYVLPVQNLVNDGQMLESFIWLEKNRINIKKHLEEIIPSYKKTIIHPIDLVKKL